MSENVTIVIKGEDKASGAIGAAAKSLEDLDSKGQGAASSAKDAGSSIDGAGASAGKMGPAMIAAGAAVAGVAVAATAAAVAIGGLIAIAQAGIDAFREQDAVNRELEQSLRGVGFAGEPLRDAIDGIDESIGALAKATMFGDEELKSMAATLIRVTGEANLTKEQMALTADIAAGMGTSTEAAASMMAQAMKGDLPRGLEKTTSLTKDQVAAINDLADPTERAAAAQAALAEAFGGASENINGYFKAVKNLEDAKGDLLQKIGEIITETGAFEPVIDAVTGALNNLEEWIDANKEAIQGFIFDGVEWAVDALTSMMETIQSLSPVIAGLITYVRLVGNQFDIAKNAVQGVIDLMIALQTQVIGRLVQGISGLIGALGKLAGFVNKDLANALNSASKATKEFSELALGVSAEAFKGVGERLGNIKDGVVNVVDILGDFSDINERVNAGLGVAVDFTKDIGDRVRDARGEMGKFREEVDSFGSSQGPDAPDGRSAKTVDDSEAKSAAKAAEEEARRNEIAMVRLAILRESDPIQRAALEMTARELELDQRTLTEQERILEQARIQASFDAAIAREDEEQHKALLDRLSEERDAKQLLLDLERERVAAAMAYNEEMLGGLDKIFPGLGELSVSLANLSELQWNTKDATDAVVSAMSGLASAGSQLSSLIAKDKRAAARVEATFNAAAAIGSFAAFAGTGFTAIPLGIAAAQHGIAAVKFGAMSGGGGGSTRPSASSAPGGGGSMSRDRATVQQSLSERGGGDTYITIDMGSSTNLETAPNTARRIGHEVERAAMSEYRI